MSVTFLPYFLDHQIIAVHAQASSDSAKSLDGNYVNFFKIIYIYGVVLPVFSLQLF